VAAPLAYRLNLAVGIAFPKTGWMSWCEPGALSDRSTAGQVDGQAVGWTDVEAQALKHSMYN
jgi:hypothetical protein